MAGGPLPTACSGQSARTRHSALTSTLMSESAHPSADLISQARAWLAEDPDEQTRAELAQIIDAVSQGKDSKDLADRFAGTLEFGTAGLRGALGAGSNRMNRVVVTRAAAGLAAYLRESGHAGGSVVIGFDARHNSEIFANDTVMVTASHNPPQDNGYKVYLGDGSQIVSPVDTQISDQIAAVGTISDLPRSDEVRTVGEEIIDRYLDTVAELAQDGPRDLSIVYTPLHGVGGSTVAQVLETAGFDPPTVVAQQERPDPQFPTVAFPNPEEPGAMDLAIALATQHGRFAVGGAGQHPAAGQRSGHQALLARHLLHRGVTGTYANSIVSSSLLAKQAAAAGQRHEETLTGFKWISRVENLAFGYEEALGYCCDPAHVKDKDGVSALLLVCEMAAEAKAKGRDLVDILSEIARQHGLHATDQLSVRFEDLRQLPAIMRTLRATPPAILGGLAVERVEDLSLGSAQLPPTDALRYSLAQGGRVIVRPSGTEPKIKCYLEVVVDVGDEDVDAARIFAAGQLDAIKVDLRSAAF